MASCEQAWHHGSPKSQDTPTKCGARKRTGHWLKKEVRVRVKETLAVYTPLLEELRS